jgi:hypothetical protein
MREECTLLNPNNCVFVDKGTRVVAALAGVDLYELLNLSTMSLQTSAISAEDQPRLLNQSRFLSGLIAEKSQPLVTVSYYIDNTYLWQCDRFRTHLKASGIFEVVVLQREMRHGQHLVPQCSRGTSPACSQSSRAW